jgi:predicted dehydrogenase
LSETPRAPVSRRKFLRRTALGAAVVGLGAPFSAAGESRTFKVGLIGCGGRGSDAANNAIQAAKKQGDNAEIHAIADLFKDKAERARRSFDVPPERTFVGFDAYEKLLETACDYVILGTPPHFRPAHLAAAIDAGKHVFTEKPVAVDVPGYKQFVAAGETAKEKGLSVAAGTQRRHQKQYIECQKRIADGAIGAIVAGRCYWNMGGLWTHERQAGESDVEWQVRNWLYFTWLSGDHIVEQHVHNLDVLNWFLGAHPVKARGMGGRQVRTGKEVFGNIFDHFATELIYPSPDPKTFPDVRVLSMCRQIAGCWDDVSEFITGTKGSSNCASHIWGASEWRWSDQQENPYVQEHIDLQQSIKEGKGALNETLNVATSTLTAILARTSCYTGREVSWDDLLKSEEKLGPAKYEFAAYPMPEVARPGKAM